jgi:PKD repeat protein
MKAFLSTVKRFLAFLRTHILLSSVVTIPVVALAVLGIRIAGGAFTTFPYLPDRTYVLAEREAPEPQTLAEVLHSDAPSIETLLRNPSIAEELLSAESLVEVVDSRLALNGLRDLEEQLDRRLDEPPEEVPSVQLPDEVKAMAGTGAGAPSAGGRSSVIPVKKLEHLPFGRVSASTQVSGQFQRVSDLKNAVEMLLTPPARPESVVLPSAINAKGLWQAPDEVLVHMTPSGDWLPDEGYDVYRVIDGEEELISKGAASPLSALAGNIEITESRGFFASPEEALEGDATDVQMIQRLYRQAQLTSDKLSELGMTAEAFRNMTYRTDSLEAKPRISGETDFLFARDLLRTIPDGIEGKIPYSDLLRGQLIHVQGLADNSAVINAVQKSSLLERLSVSQVTQSVGFGPKDISLGTTRAFEIVQEVFDARQQLATLSFVDEEFAEAAGFLVRDDLSGLDLPEGTKVTYRVEASGGVTASIDVTKGVTTPLSKPQGFIGYGIDGVVALRWSQPESAGEKGILSGYFIERKVDGEDGFTRVNKEPIVASYMLDDTDIFFESPVFYEDDLKDGLTAQYRIVSMDIFGRESEPSELLSVYVEKVTPPNAPAVSPPSLSMPRSKDRKDEAEAPQVIPDKSGAVQLSLEQNQNKRGIALPIYTDSADTVRFTIYRAVAVGAKSFGPPQIIADLAYDNPAKKVSSDLQASGNPIMKVEKAKGAKQVFLESIHPGVPNLVYFDSDVKEGCTYKYWASAWDSWNNESAWSESVSLGVPTQVAPTTPGTLAIDMLSRELPDLSELPPGIIQDSVISLDVLNAGGPSREYDTDTSTIKVADAQELKIGSFLSDVSLSSMPHVISTAFNNLPAEKYFHMFIAVRGEDVFPDNTFRLKWTAYSGDGLGGYEIYTPLFPLLSLDEMQGMSRSELLGMGHWLRVNDETVTQNQLVVGGLSRTSGELHLFLVCLKPETPDEPSLAQQIILAGYQPSQASSAPHFRDMVSYFLDVPEGGYVRLDWEVPDDPQVKFCRVYRSEVPSFKKPVDESTLEWTLVGDNLTTPVYTERVEQSFAHYYYYKVVSVSPWAVESQVGAIERFRVPSTKPPQTPNLLLPLSRKDGVEVNFSAVTHCDRYEIYRAEIPKVDEAVLGQLTIAHPQLFGVLFDTPSEKDTFLTGTLRSGLAVAQSPLSASKPLTSLDKFKTVTQRNSLDLIKGLSAVGDSKGLSAYSDIMNTLGPLALMEYRDLSLEMMGLVTWTKVGELPADYDTVEAVDPATGLLKPLSIIDETAEYGITYLYTVQAWNDDNLGSSRAEPVEATPRRNRSFDPIGGLAGEIEGGKPHLSWNAPTMQNLTSEQCRKDTVGYIVYRSDTQDGVYYQASPLLFEQKWTDTDADVFAFNWYRVKVLDTGGYLSEFSEPVLVRSEFFSNLVPIIPGDVTPVALAPKIQVGGSAFEVKAGTPFETSYTLSGTEPITVTLKATIPGGGAVSGFTLDAPALKVRAAGTLGVGTYNVMLTAKNSAGESSATFSLTVQTTEPAVAAPKISLGSSSFSVEQGTPFHTVYTLTGTEPVTVTIKAIGPGGGAVSGFTVDAASRTINGPGSLSPGTYRVTVTAKNTAGQDETTFALTVTAKTPTAEPPRITLRGSEFTVTQGTPFQTTYSLSGTEPISVVAVALGPDGGIIPGFFVEEGGRTVNASPDVGPGQYRVTVTASNAAGEDSAAFSLTVEPKPVLVPPSLPRRSDGYSFKMTRLLAFSVQLSASGSEPMTWSLEPVSPRMTVPSQASIDNTGYLTVGRTIPAGNYSFVVKVENAAGYDSQTVFLEVKEMIIRPTSGGSVNFISPTGGLPLLTGDFEVASGPVAQVTGQSDVERFDTNQMRCSDFWLTDVKLSRPKLVGLLSGYSGTANLRLGSELVPVSIAGASIGKSGTADAMQAGTVYMTEPFEFSELGVTLVSLNLTPQAGVKPSVSGYVKSTSPGKNLAGDLFAIEFSDAELRPGSIIVTQKPGLVALTLPDIRYEQFTISGIKSMWIDLTGLNDLLTLGTDSVVTMKSHLETLSNEGMWFGNVHSLSFDLEGRLSGVISTSGEQSLQMLVPGGAALRVEDAALFLVKGVVQSNSYLLGKMILPFEQEGIKGAGAQGVYVGGHMDTNIMDELLARVASGQSLDKAMQEALQEALVKFAETVQQSGLLIVPDDFALQDLCSYIPIEVHGWGGKGFLVESSFMTPTRVTERSLDMTTQRSQAIVVTSPDVSVDLDRDSFIPAGGVSGEGGEGGSSGSDGSAKPQTPKETQEPFWVGIVMKSGTLALPSAFITTVDEKPIVFELAEGEMIYDLNGFNYQTFLYNDKGVPASFAEALGGFDDVLVYDCLLDLYRNKVNLEINAEVAVELFLNQRVKVKLYTNKEDNEDGRYGEFLCSVAPTRVESATATGIDVIIDVGWLKPDGMHLSGSLEMDTAEIVTSEPLPFTEMVVPAHKVDTNKTKDPQRKYANVPLDRPVNIDFKSFTMEIRALDLEYVGSDATSDSGSAPLIKTSDPVNLTLHGATLISDNIPMQEETTDNLLVVCNFLGNKERVSRVSYENSHSKLEANFDGCIEVTGVLTPKTVQGDGGGGQAVSSPGKLLLCASGSDGGGDKGGDDGLVEFDTGELGLSFLSQLKSSPIKTEARFGYDTVKERCYFAVGIGFYGVPIHFGFGSIKDFAGIVSYNMEVQRDEHRRFQFPDDGSQMLGFIQGLEVYRGEGTKFAAGISGTLTVAELCEVRKLYFGFESGPIVDAGGDLCLPLKVSAMVGGGSPYTEVGTVVILYSHPERYFSMSMFYDMELIMVKAHGEIGLEYSPRLFGVYVGYPEMLQGRLGFFGAGVGVGFIIDDDGESLIAAKLELGYDAEVNVSIVYIRGYVYAGAGATYRFDAKELDLELWLRGGIQGGIKVKGKRFNIISFHLDAKGNLISSPPFDSWLLKASCKVSYSLDLWLTSYEGTVTAKFDKRF